MHRLMTQHPLFSLSARKSGELEAIIAGNRRAVKYLRKRQYRVAYVLLCHALVTLESLSHMDGSEEVSTSHPTAADECAVNSSNDRRRMVRRSSFEVLDGPQVFQEGVLINVTIFVTQPREKIKVVLLFNLGLVQQLQGDFTSAIHNYEQVSSEASSFSQVSSTGDGLNNAPLLFVQLGVHSNLVECYLEIQEDEMAMKHQNLALNILSQHVNDETREAYRLVLGFGRLCNANTA